MPNDIVTERQKEDAYLQETLTVLSRLIKQYSNSVHVELSDVDDLKEYIWENRADLDPVELASSMREVNDKVRFATSSHQKNAMLIRAQSSPYFARIDFTMSQPKIGKLNQIYIGITSIRDEHAHFYVYDWRAPISSMFYDYEIGLASYDALKGKILGHISLKRQYEIKNGVLINFFDSSIVINDDFLQRALAQTASKKLKTIIATIQKEQNSIIRNINDNRLIIQGFAGSGKTTVALHRIAYLLYADKNISSKEILIFSPSSIFTDYISSVLPELGESNVQQTTFDNLLQKYIGRNSESYNSLIETYYSRTDHSNDQIKSSVYKLSCDFIEKMNKFIDSYMKSFEFTQDLSIAGIIFEQSKLNKLLKTTFSDLPISERITSISKYICDYVGYSGKYHAGEINEVITKSLHYEPNINDLYAKMLFSNDLIMDPVLKNSNKRNATTKGISFADSINMLYFQAKIIGFSRNPMIKHVVIDEVQDYTPTQILIILFLFPNANLTILGDINQTINPFFSYQSLEEIGKLFVSQHLKYKYLELNKTYRSSNEIVNFTNAILGLNNASPIRIHANIPVILKNMSYSNIVTELIKDLSEIESFPNISNIAVITKNSNDIISIKAELAKHNISADALITTKDRLKLSHLQNKIVILPSYLAKGLEFDAVIVISKDEYEYFDDERRLYYVICTRALHSLIIYNKPFFIKN